MEKLLALKKRKGGNHGVGFKRHKGLLNFIKKNQPFQIGL
jgi:hypothetical protein